MDSETKPAPAEVAANFPVFLRVTINFRDWLHVLSSPRHLQAMQRMPTREHLLYMLDIYMYYAKTAERALVRKDDEWLALAKQWQADPVKRVARALELRAAIEQWTTPEISREITLAARALLHEEGREEPEEGWDAFEVELPLSPDHYLLWPENLLGPAPGEGEEAPPGPG